LALIELEEKYTAPAKSSSNPLTSGYQNIYNTHGGSGFDFLPGPSTNDV